MHMICIFLFLNKLIVVILVITMIKIITVAIVLLTSY